LPRFRPHDLIVPSALSFGAMFAVGAFGRALMSAVIPIEAFDLLGSARNVSLLYFGVAAANLLASFAIPALIHAFRRRRVYVLAILIGVMAPLLVGLDTVATLTLGALLREVGAIALLVTQNLYIMDHIRRRDFVRSEPLRLFFGAAAWGFGPALGVVIHQDIGPWVAFGTAAAFMLVELVWFRVMNIADMALVAPRAAKPRNPMRFIARYWSQPRLRLAYAIAFSRSCWWVLLTVYGPIYMIETGAGDTAGGYLVSAGNMLLFLVLVFGLIARKIGVRKVIVWALLLSGLGTLVIAGVYPSPWLGAAFFVVAAIGASALDAVGGIPFLRAVRARERAEMTLVYVTFIQMSQLVPAAVFAILLSFFDLPAIFVAMSALLIWTAWIARWVPKSM
jgi:MFS family permease